MKSALEEIGHFINGEFTNGLNAHNTTKVFNPVTGDEIAKCYVAAKEEVDAAVASAQQSQVSWGQVPALKRTRVLFKYKELLEKHQEEIIKLISKCHGKDFVDAEGDFTRGLEEVEFACAAPQLLKSEMSDNVAKNVDCYTLRQPLGVVAGITPFNFPVMIPMWMAPLAIVAGNSFILKPSEKTPLASIMLAKLFQDAGLPDGVFNLLQGTKNTVTELITHKDVAAVSFVGSTNAAKSVYQTATSCGKRVQAMGGAKNHCLVMSDSDIEQAVTGILSAAFGSSGQRCMAIAVVVAVGDEVATKIRSKLVSEMTSLRLSPMTSKEHVTKINGLINDGVANGAELVVDGRNVVNSTGFMLGASLFDHVTADMTIYQEELFAPVLSIVRVENYQQGLDIINNHPYGNGAVVYTQSGQIARNFAQDVAAGMVGVNVPIPIPMAFYSFGGWKQSRFGDCYMHGMHGVHFYTKMKTITVRY